MRKVVRNEFVVRCAPEEAFELLSDLRNEPELELIPLGLFELAFPLLLLSLDKQGKNTADKIRTTIEARYGAAISAQ